MPVTAMDSLHHPRHVGSGFRATSRDGRGHEPGDHEQRHACHSPAWGWLPKFASRAQNGSEAAAFNLGEAARHGLKLRSPLVGRSLDKIR